MRQVLSKYGYCYVALNRWSDSYAVRSAMSLRKHDPDAHITLFTDQTVRNKIFDNIVPISHTDKHESLKGFQHYPDQGILAKARCIPKAPYEYCIFSDYDIYFNGNISDIFVLMEEGGYDFCATYDAGEVSINSFYPDIPYCMSKFHLGLLAWHNNDKMKALFEMQREFIIEKGKEGICGGAIDENTFTRAVHKSRDVRWCILPSVYCLRFVFPYVVRGEVKVLHGRSETYEDVIKKVNENIQLRVGFEEEIMALYEPGVGIVR